MKCSQRASSPIRRTRLASDKEHTPQSTAEPTATRETRTQGRRFPSAESRAGRAPSAKKAARTSLGTSGPSAGPGHAQSDWDPVPTGGPRSGEPGVAGAAWRLPVKGARPPSLPGKARVLRGSGGARRPPGPGHEKALAAPREAQMQSRLSWGPAANLTGGTCFFLRQVGTSRDVPR